MIGISVVIGTRNQAAVLHAVLESFSRQSLQPDAFEVVIVDSASTDGTRELCEGRRWPFPLRYRMRADAGKVAARNDAIRQARGALVLLTDGDVVADRELLAQHVDAHARCPGRVVVGRQLLVDRLDQVGQFPREALRRPHRAGDRLGWSEFVTGNASLDRALLIDVGLFDEDFRGYGYEDYELGYRLTARGVPIVYEPAAVNWHCHAVRFEDELGRKREAGHSAVLFARKHPSRVLRAQLGLHPVNAWLWRHVADDGWLHRTGVAWGAWPGVRGRLGRWFLVEQAFQAGVRKARAS